MLNRIAPPVPTALLQTKRLLIVDEDRIHATITSIALFSIVGICPDLVISMSDAFTYLENQPAPDLVLMDYYVRDETCVPLATWMRWQPQFQTTLRVLFSGVNFDSVRREVDSGLFTAFIEKPIVVPVLAQRVIELLTPQSDTTA